MLQNHETKPLYKTIEHIAYSVPFFVLMVATNSSISIIRENQSFRAEIVSLFPPFFTRAILFQINRNHGIHITCIDHFRRYFSALYFQINQYNKRWSRIRNNRRHENKRGDFYRLHLATIFLLVGIISLFAIIFFLRTVRVTRRGKSYFLTTKYRSRSNFVTVVTVPKIIFSFELKYSTNSNSYISPTLNPDTIHRFIPRWHGRDGGLFIERISINRLYRTPSARSVR